MTDSAYCTLALGLLLVSLITFAGAQSFRFQGFSATITQSDPCNSGANSSEPAYSGPTKLTNDPIRARITFVNLPAVPEGAQSLSKETTQL